MSVYDAGAIEATARLNRDPFNEGLRQAQKDGDEFAKKVFTAKLDVDTDPAKRGFRDANLRGDEWDKKKFTAKIDVDTKDADAAISRADIAGQGLSRTYRNVADETSKVAKEASNLEQAQQRVAAAHNKAEDAAGRLRVAEQKLQELRDTANVSASRIIAAEERVAKLRRDSETATAGLGRAQADLIKVGDRLSSSLDKTSASGSRLGSVFTSIGMGFDKVATTGAQISPMMGLIAGAVALVGPAAGVATAGLFGIAGAAGVALLAYQGLKKELGTKEGVGLPLQSEIKGITAGLDKLERLAAQAAGPGIVAGLDNIKKFLPTLNPLVGTLGTNLGYVADNLSHAFTNAIKVAEPLIFDFGKYMVGASDAVERFTRSEKFQQFIGYARAELPIVGHDLRDIGEAAVNLAVALQPVGDGLLKLIDYGARATSTVAKVFAAANGGTQPYSSAQGKKPSFLRNVNDQLVNMFEGRDTNTTNQANVKRQQDAKKAAEQAAKDAAEMQKYYKIEIAAARASEDELGALGAKYGITTQHVLKYAAALGITADMVKTGAVSAAALAQAVDVVDAAYAKGDASVTTYADAVDRFAKSAGGAADRGALIGATLRAANGDALGFGKSLNIAAVANQGLVDAMAQGALKTVDWKTGLIDFNNAAAAPLVNALDNVQTAAMNAAAATFQHELHTRGATKASDDAYQTYVDKTQGALIDEAHHFGMTNEEATKFAQTYFGIGNAPDIKKKIEQIGGEGVQTLLNSIGRQLAILTGRPWDPTVGVNDQATGPLVGITKQMQAIDGMHAFTYVTTILDQNTAADINKHHSALGNLFKAYAFGGIEKHLPQIAPASGRGKVRVWAEPETKGEAYIPLANDYRRPRAQAIAAETVKLLGGVAQFATGGVFGYTGVNYGNTGAKAPARKVGGAGGGSAKGAAKAHPAAPNPAAFGGHVYSTQVAALNARSSAASTLSGTFGQDVTLLARLSVAAAGTVASSLSKIISSMTKASSYGFTNTNLVRSFQRESALLNAEVAKRNGIAAAAAAATARLVALQKQADTIRTNAQAAIMGTFDFGTSGSGYASGIKSTLQQKVADAKKFADLLRQAGAAGLNTTAIEQIANEGPDKAGKNLEAIVGASKTDKTYVSTLNTLYGQLGTSAAAVGSQAANAAYGAQMAREQAAIRSLNAQQAAEQRKINAQLAQMSAQVRALQATLARQAADAHNLALIRARGH